MSNGSEIMDLSDPVRVAEADVGAALRGCRVLVAHDQSSHRWALVGALRGAGARVSEARDGAELLDLAREAEPELVLASAELPGVDGCPLREFLRREPALSGAAVVLLAEAQPLESIEDSAASRPLVEAMNRLLQTLQRGEASSPAGPMSEVDPVERENARGQSTVTMCREPANRAPRSSYPVWRMRASAEPQSHAAGSGFDWELRMMSRILGAAFIALVVATVGLIAWQLGVRNADPLGATEAAPELRRDAATESKRPVEGPPSQPGAPPAALEAPARVGLYEFSGQRVPTLDPALDAGPGQGVLELRGPPGVEVAIDGIERGPLPLSWVVEQGRHRVRYRNGPRFVDRFYYVEAGTTRVARAFTRPGGFVDAR